MVLKHVIDKLAARNAERLSTEIKLAATQVGLETSQDTLESTRKQLIQLRKLVDAPEATLHSCHPSAYESVQVPDTVPAARQHVYV